MLMNFDTRAEQNRQVANRANIYKLFAECFKYPGSQLAEILPALKTELTSYDEAMGVNCERLVESYRQRTSLQELQIEYSKLFVGPYQLDAPPYSSVYLDKEDLVMGESTQEAIHYYVEAGLNPSSENHEPPDHISIELEFMYFLLFQNVVEKDDHFFELSHQFMNRHLALWVYAFTKRIIESTKNAFYLELATLLDCFFSKEKQLFLQSTCMQVKQVAT